MPPEASGDGEWWVCGDWTEGASAVATLTDRPLRRRVPGRAVVEGDVTTAAAGGPSLWIHTLLPRSTSSCGKLAILGFCLMLFSLSLRALCTYGLSGRPSLLMRPQLFLWMQGLLRRAGCMLWFCHWNPSLLSLTEALLPVPMPVLQPQRRASVTGWDAFS